jgi:outer membrane protein OmpA-like peptidoglycan-associated protein
LQADSAVSCLSRDPPNRHDAASLATGILTSGTIRAGQFSLGKTDMGKSFKGTFICTAELFSGSKSLEKVQPKSKAAMKPIEPGDYKLVMVVKAKAELASGGLPKGMTFDETFEVSWKIVVDDKGKVSFENRKTSKTKYEYAVGIGGMVLDTYETGKMGVEITINDDTERGDFEVTLKGLAAASKAPKVVTFPAMLIVGAFPTNVFDVKKIKQKPPGYADWAGLKKFYDNLPALTREKIENGEKPGDKRIEILGFADDTGNAADNSKLGEKRASDVMGWFKTFSGNRSDAIYLTKGKGSGIAGKGKEDPKKRMAIITVLCEKEV